MISRATLLAQPAHQRDDVKVGKAFGQIVETCVACYSAYLLRPDVAKP